MRLLGLSHVLVWTPVLIYLGRQWTSFDRRTLFGAWVTVLIVTNGISLAFDYVDVVRYFAGDGALPQ